MVTFTNVKILLFRSKYSKQNIICSKNSKIIIMTGKKIKKGWSITILDKTLSNFSRNLYFILIIIDGIAKLHDYGF